MGCKEVGHQHNWPTEGKLVIQRCEIRCNFCQGAKGLKPWKYAWFLRRHVRAMHCTPGRGKTPYPNLEVAVTWKDNTKAKKKAKSRKRTIKGEIKNETKDEIKEEDVSSSDAEEEGMAAPGAQSVGTGWVNQPIYADVPNQHPGETGSFNGIASQDMHFQQEIVLGDHDNTDLMDTGNILNYDDVGAFLSAQTESFVQFIDEPGFGAMDIEEESDEDNIKVADVMAKRSATYFNLDDNGDTLPMRPDRLEIRRDSFMDSENRFFMSDCSSDSVVDIIPLATMSSIAHSRNSVRPPADKDTAQMLSIYEQMSQAMRKQGKSTAQMLDAIEQLGKPARGDFIMEMDN